MIVAASSRVFLRETVFCLCDSPGVHDGEEHSDYGYDMVPPPWSVLMCQQFYSSSVLWHHQCKCQHSEKGQKKEISIIIEIVLTLPLKPWKNLKKGSQAAISESQVYGNSKC